MPTYLTRDKDRNYGLRRGGPNELGLIIGKREIRKRGMDYCRLRTPSDAVRLKSKRSFDWASALSLTAIDVAIQFVTQNDICRSSPIMTLGPPALTRHVWPSLRSPQQAKDPRSEVKPQAQYCN